MGKATGFMEYPREKPSERNPLTRLKDWREYSTSFPDETLSRQGARCMDCATPFCHMGMELNRVYIGLSDSQSDSGVERFSVPGRWKEALDAFNEDE